MIKHSAALHWARTTSGCSPRQQQQLERKIPWQSSRLQRCAPIPGHLTRLMLHQNSSWNCWGSTVAMLLEKLELQAHGHTERNVQALAHCCLQACAADLDFMDGLHGPYGHWSHFP